MFEPLEFLEVQNPNDECLSGITVDSEINTPSFRSSRYKLLEPENSDQETSIIVKSTIEDKKEADGDGDSVSETEPQLDLQLLSDSISEPLELNPDNIAL